MPSWKVSQSKKQKSQQIKLALIALGLILGLVLLSQIFKFAQVLTSPWTETKLASSYNWDGDFNLNLVLRSKTIQLLSYNPKDEKITIIDIPDQTYLDVPGGLGNWLVSSIFGLGGDDLLKSSLSSFFGIPIDGYLDPVNLEDLTDKNPFGILSLLPKIKSDLAPIDLFKIKMALSSVRFDKINKNDLEKMGLLDKASLADGTEVYTGDAFKLDSLSSDLADPVIKSEHKTVAIFNSTTHPGLAQKAARLLNNIGADVIIVSNSDLKFDKTKVSGEKSKTLQKIQQIFGSNGTIDPNKELASSRAQINVFLGEDFFKRL